MPPKRLTTAPVYTLNSNVMHEISKRVKSKNAARLSIALGSRKVPGLSKAVKALNTQRKEDAVRIAKAGIHGIARRVVTVMRGIRMLVDKKRPKEGLLRVCYFQNNGAKHKKQCMDGPLRPKLHHHDQESSTVFFKDVGGPRFWWSEDQRRIQRCL